MPSTLTDTASRIAHETRGAGERMAHRLREHALPSRRDVNVGLLERVGSGVLGAAMALWGLMLVVRGRSILGGLGMAATGAGLAYRGTTGHCPAYKAIGVSEQDASSTSHPLGRFIHISHRVRINRPAQDLYAYWHDFKNLPHVMRHLKSVERRHGDRSHWVAAAPRGRTVEWDAKITEERPGELIAWRSMDGASVPNHGHVRFEALPHGQGTNVEVSLNYRPPAGVVGALLARAVGESPSQQLQEDLRRFKQVMEAGETATTTGQPRGRCA